MKEEREATCLEEAESPGGMHPRAIYVAFVRVPQVIFSSQTAILKKYIVA